MNEIKNKFPYTKDIIDNYYEKNFQKFFINGDYNYSLLPVVCRSNSYLENYNLY